MRDVQFIEDMFGAVDFFNYDPSDNVHFVDRFLNLACIKSQRREGWTKFGDVQGAGKIDLLTKVLNCYDFLLIITGWTVSGASRCLIDGPGYTMMLRQNISPLRCTYIGLSYAKISARRCKESLL